MARLCWSLRLALYAFKPLCILHTHTTTNTTTIPQALGITSMSLGMLIASVSNSGMVCQFHVYCGDR